MTRFYCQVSGGFQAGETMWWPLFRDLSSLTWSVASTARDEEAYIGAKMFRDPKYAPLP